MTDGVRVETSERVSDDGKKLIITKTEYRPDGSKKIYTKTRTIKHSADHQNGVVDKKAPLTRQPSSLEDEGTSTDKKKVSGAIQTGLLEKAKSSSTPFGRNASISERMQRPYGKTKEELVKLLEAGNELFEDPDFPAADSSLFFSEAPRRKCVWKRPGEICNDPHFIFGGADRFDIKQGELGNCWLLATISSLCNHQALLDNVVPKHQTFSKNYVGLFYFRIWQYGQWVDVVVDDRLPTYHNRLVYMHSAQDNEFWTALLEKAYAKLYGSYEALKGGSMGEAMEDFTGGLTEVHDTSQSLPEDFYKIMLKAVEKRTLMGCSIDASEGQIENELDNGLIIGHAYSITDVKQIHLKSRGKTTTVDLLRIRNPWGNEYEWKGAWSDNSKEMAQLSDDQKRAIGLVVSDDGEFWMCYEDFKNNFTKIEICNVGPDSVAEDNQKKKNWQQVCYDGSWTSNVSAGGCRNFLDTFWTNPQYRVEVIDPDEDDDADDTGTLLVALMQKDRRRKKMEGLDFLTIGLAIYRLKDPDCGLLDRNFFKKYASKAKSPFINSRQICGRYKLSKGHYVIVPSTFEPNQDGDFLIRVYTEKPVGSAAVDQKTEISTPSIAPPLITKELAAKEREAKAKFLSKAGDDEVLNAEELRDILNDFLRTEMPGVEFGRETCKSLLALVDDDYTGKLDYEEFKKLLLDFRHLMIVYVDKDTDKTGSFDSYQLRMALNALGYRVSNKVFNLLVQRHSRADGKVYFDDYVMCVTRLKDVMTTFQKHSSDGQTAQFTLEDFTIATMYT